MSWLVVIMVIVVVLGLIPVSGWIFRRQKIYRKYGRTDKAKKIIKKIVWVGQTTEELIDSLGQPVDIDQSVMKTKTKEVWKYQQKGVNRFGLKMKIEDNAVAGWDEKM